jgi:hypothetical protein
VELHGSLVANLGSALDSARRHRGKPIHSDTLGFWQRLLAYSRSCAATSPDPAAAQQLITSLETELADRG